ncbi:hypothetical protein ACLMJK_009208 [Lecanora helva]
MPGAKIYIVNSLELIAAVQRHHKTLAFPPIEAKMGRRMNAWSDEADKVIMKNVNGEEGDWGMSMESYQAMRAALAPGVDLDAMNRIMVQNVAASLERLQPEKGRPSTNINLMHWLRHELTMATTNAVYGPRNPYANRDVENGFWDLVGGLTMMFVNFMPSMTAPKGYRGRETVARAFVQYYNDKGHETGSAWAKNRYDVSIKHSISVEDTARFECGGGIAILVNTVPTVFWMLYHVYSNPLVLEQLRQELSTIILTSKTADNVSICKIDITQIKTRCPLLTSTFQEVLRCRAMGTSVRQVMEDTLLDGKYLLKKDGIIQMPSRVIHTDQEIWGHDIDSFNHKRFIKDFPDAAEKKNYGAKRPSPAAFRAFGGGHTLCPGRHFATTEIMATAIMFILRYEVKPASGHWTPPTCANTNIASTIMEPDSDISVVVEPRAGFKDVSWGFGLADSEMVFAVAEEDLK